MPMIITTRSILRIKGFTNDINTILSTIDMEKGIWKCEELIPISTQEEDEIEKYQKWGCLDRPIILGIQYPKPKTKQIKSVVITISSRSEKYPKALVEHLINRYPMFIDVLYCSKDGNLCGVDRYENEDYYLRSMVINNHYREEICRRLWDEPRENCCQTDLNFN